jgi:hypothetical protein
MKQDYIDVNQGLGWLIKEEVTHGLFIYVQPKEGY